MSDKPAEYIVYPQGGARPVVHFKSLVALLNKKQLIYLNGLIASRLISETTGEKNGLENPEENS